MKPRCSKQRSQALTLVEVLVVIAILVVLVFLLLPSLAGSTRSVRIQCVNNVKQVGLGYRIWAGDNNDKYPMEVPVTNGGTMGLAGGRNAWINYFVMAKELSTPKLLHCPSDTNGFASTNFLGGFDNQNVSYFVNLDASAKSPQAPLSGDDNFEINGTSVKSGLLEFSSSALITWSSARHHLAGNIGLTDGSVQSCNNSGLTNLLRQTGLTTYRFAIP